MPIIGWLHHADHALAPIWRSVTLALVIEREPGALASAAPFLMLHRDCFLAQIRQPGEGFMASFEAIAATGYRPSLAHCVEVATAYLSQLGRG
jgi:hypothetical protein